MDALEEKQVQTPAGDDQNGTAADPDQNGNTQVNTSAAGVNAKPSTVKPVKTGDYTNVMIPAAALVLAAALGGTMIYIRRKRS